MLWWRASADDIFIYIYIYISLSLIYIYISLSLIFERLMEIELEYSCPPGK